MDKITTNKYKMSNWKTKDTWIKNYLTSCEMAVKRSESFSSFKSDPRYFNIVNKMKKDVSDEYYRYIVGNYNHLLKHFDKFKTNDIIGSPDINEYDEVGCVSGANLMYVKVLGDIEHYIGNDFKTVAEIGGGFGGQAKVMLDYFTDISKYYMYDIDIVMKLQYKYLSTFGYDCIPSSVDDNIEDIDLVVANYSWSELSVPLKMEYIDKVISKAKSGYISTNCSDDIGLELLIPILKDKEVTILDYIPGKGKRHGKVIIWK